MNKKQEVGASLFGRSMDLIEGDPLEEIFALNLGDFISEHFISDDLAEKISAKSKNKLQSLKEQLSELISIYSLDNTLCVLGFNSKEDYVIYNSIAKTIVQMLDMDACHIYLTKDNAKGLNETKNDLVLVGSSIAFNDDIYSHNIGYKLSENTFVTEAFNEQETIEAKNPQLSVRFCPFAKLDEEKVKTFTVVPMHNNSNPVGIIVVESYEDKNFKDEYLKLIESIASLFATSMGLQKLVEETTLLLEDEHPAMGDLQHMRAELTALIGDLGDHQQLFVKRLANAVDTKGQYETSHSQNTADMAKALCRQIGLNEKTIDLIYYAGLLQNIGKITLPEEIFTHNGKLSTEDWEKLQNHPNVGVNLLMNINFLSEVVPYIHYHKERWDGKGMPEGLNGYSIPLGSRIIAVADAYCAMTANRSYRAPMAIDKALDIMKEEAGIKWDPQIVQALIEVVKR